VLDSSGWMEWAGKLATSDYAEYNTHDSNGTLVKVDQRIPPSRQLSKAEADKLTVQSWLTGWNPAK